MNRTHANTLYGIAAVLFLFGISLRVLPVRVTAGDAAAPVMLSSETAAVLAQEPEATPPAFDGIVQANVFSRERTPPGQRYVPDELRRPAVSSTTPARAERRLRLYGVVVGPAESQALIDADPRIPGAELYRVGDSVAGLRLVSIGGSSAVLEGPDGRIVLKLSEGSGRSR